MTSTYKRPESVLVVIYTLGGDVLMLRRRHPDDFWQSVTGSLEWGEDPAHAAHREVQEETGLEPGNRLIDCQVTNQFPILPAWRSRYAPGTPFNTEHVYRLGYENRPQIQLSQAEHSEYGWLPIAEAAARATSHTNRDAILALDGSTFQ